MTAGGRPAAPGGTAFHQAVSRSNASATLQQRGFVEHPADQLQADRQPPA